MAARRSRHFKILEPPLSDSLRPARPWAELFFPLCIAALVASLCGLWVKDVVAPPVSGNLHISEFKLPPASPEHLIIAPHTIKVLAPQTARALNASVPYSQEPNPAARPFLFDGLPDDLERAVSCLAAAQLYEAGGDEAGQRAVAQVVLNRLRHPAFPKSICAVVFQGSERKTGCQFTFTCDGAMAHKRSNAAWDRARSIAKDVLKGAVFKPVGYATHYHTDWVVPYWSETLDKIVAIDTHLFFRWTGGWGRPGAFSWRGKLVEPRIKQLSQASHVHDEAHGLLSPTALAAGNESASSPQLIVRASTLNEGGQLPDGVKLISRLPKANVFIMEYPDSLDTATFGDVARTFCKSYSECNLMVWMASAKAPKEFPLKNGAFSSMAFNYIQDESQGSHRMFWNCRNAQPPIGSKCMGDRADH